VPKNLPVNILVALASFKQPHLLPCCKEKKKVRLQAEREKLMQNN
jgi:hypothetical protein